MPYRGWKYIEVWVGNRWARHGGLWRSGALVAAEAKNLEYRQGLCVRVVIIR